MRNTIPIALIASALISPALPSAELITLAGQSMDDTQWVIWRGEVQEDTGRIDELELRHGGHTELRERWMAKSLEASGERAMLFMVTHRGDPQWGIAALDLTPTNSQESREPVIALSPTITEAWEPHVRDLLPQEGRGTEAQPFLWHIASSLDPTARRAFFETPVATPLSPAEEREFASAGERLLVIDLASGEVHVPFDGAATHSLIDGMPSWSPSGDCLAFHTHISRHNILEMRPPYTDCQDWHTQDLQIWEAVSEEARQVVPHGYSSGSLMFHRPFSPSWSSDGQRVAFAHRTTDPSVVPDPFENLWWADLAAGGEANALTFNFTNAIRSPLWLPDGSGMLFRGEVGGEMGVYRIDLDSGRPEQLWSCESDNPQHRSPLNMNHWAISSSGRWLAIWSGRGLYLTDLDEDPVTPRRVAEAPDGFTVLDVIYAHSSE